MAGLSIVRTAGGLLHKKDKLNFILNSLNYLDINTSDFVLTEDDIFIGWNRHDQYPIHKFETEEYLIIVEGRVYNKDLNTLETELLQQIGNFSEARLKIWMLQADGDFLIYSLNKKTRDLFIFNDALGRLPLYYKRGGNGNIVSRFFHFITEVENEVEFDKLGMGEFLLLGYTFGARTLFKNISQLRPGSALQISNSEIKEITINNFNFQTRSNEGRPFKDIVSDASELFSQSIINRFNNEKTNLIALSSGMDSRTVAACMAKHKIPFQTATMVFTNGAAKEEIDIAEKISGIFNAKWNPMLLDPPVGKEVMELLNIKEGMSYLATTFLLPFYREINYKFGREINFITGDKGDKVTLSFDNILNKFRTHEDLIDFILGEHAMLHMDQLCEIIDIKKEDILHDMLLLLKTYPETDLRQKYIHYRAIEKSHKLAYQNDDRHKRYYWSYCPLTSTPFVNFMFNCSDEIKKRHQLFTALLQSYSREAADITYTNFKAPITSLKGKAFMASVYYLYPLLNYKFRTEIKDLFFGGNPVINPDSIFFKVIDEQLNNSDGIKKYFKISDSSSLKKYKMVLLQCAFTLTSLLDKYLSKDAVLANYTNEIFDHMT